MSITLDSRDKKLLYELDLNSRQSFNELARKLRLSKGAVIYRIANLEKAGIIKCHNTIVDTGKLGYVCFRLYLKLSGATPEKEQEIVDFLAQKESVIWLISIEGDYNIGAAILAKSVKEMNSLWKELLEKYVNYLDARFLAILIRVSYFSRAYLIDLKQNTREFTAITEPEEAEIDKTDAGILEIIASNARMPVIEIAEKLGITSKTVITRIRTLEKKKIILGYRTVFDLEKLGYQYFKVHFGLHNVTEEKIKHFRHYIKSHPNIVYDNEVLGGDDIEIEVQVKSLPELRKIIEEIKSDFAEIIKDYKTMLFYKEHKLLFLPAKR